MILASSPKTEMAVIDIYSKTVLFNRILLKEQKLGNFYSFLWPVINITVHCVIPSKRGKGKSALMHSCSISSV